MAVAFFTYSDPNRPLIQDNLVSLHETKLRHGFPALWSATARRASEHKLKNI